MKLYAKKYIGLNVILSSAMAVFSLMELAVRNGYMLRWYDEMSLFEPTGFFFSRFMHFPGGLLRYAGTWLTQFCYHPWLGASALTALWILLAWLCRRAFGLTKWASAISYILPLALFASVAQLDEAWVSMKSDGFLFFPTLGYVFTVGAVFVYSLLPAKTYIRLPYVVIAAACYCFVGFFALLAALICVFFEIADAVRGKDWTLLASAAAGIAACVLIPQAYYIYFPGNTADNDYLYMKGLPDFYIEPYDMYLWTPFIVATAVVMLLAVISICRVAAFGKAWGITGLTAIAVSSIWVVAAEKKSEQLRATVLMTQAMDRSDWTRVKDIMRRIREYPNYTMRMLENVAALRLGEPISDMSKHNPVNIDARHSESFTVTAFVNVPVNFQIGELNQSYRWAMEHCVQYGKKVFYLKYMVKAALLSGEPQLARRYNDILLRTMFHRKWAKDMERYIDNPSLIDSNPEFLEILEAQKTSAALSAAK